MQSGHWHYGKNVRAAELVRAMFDSRTNCGEILDSYDAMLASIWGFAAQLVGDTGTRAILGRAVQLAGTDHPLALRTRVGTAGVDLSELRSLAADPACPPAELAAAASHVFDMVLRTLYELTGDMLIDPLLDALENEPSL